MYETSLLLIRRFHIPHAYIYKYKLKANTCTISPNYNTPVCAHNPTSKASAKTPTPRKAQQL